MIVGVPRETFPGERRVAIVPAVLPTLAKAGLQVLLEAGAGVAPLTSSRKFFAMARTIAPAKPILRCFIATRCSSVFFAPSAR
jgi:alanine dehydrogenase